MIERMQNEYKYFYFLFSIEDLLESCDLRTPFCALVLSRVPVFLIALAAASPPWALTAVAIPWGKIGVGAEAICVRGWSPTTPSAGVDVTMTFC